MDDERPAPFFVRLHYYFCGELFGKAVFEVPYIGRARSWLVALWRRKLVFDHALSIPNGRSFRNNLMCEFDLFGLGQRE